MMVKEVKAGEDADAPKTFGQKIRASMSSSVYGKWNQDKKS